MRIGILTFHRAHNYGAVLQCFALQEFLRKQGHSVKVIDYNNKALWDYYNWFKQEELQYAISNPRKVIQRCIKLIIKWDNRIHRYHTFTRFQRHHLELCPVSEIMHHPFDLVLIGSDQVWNTRITQGFDPYYWGQFGRPLQTKVATYAASIRGIWEENDWPTVQDYLQSLDAVSVREKSLSATINTLFPLISPIVVPDPVLLLSAKEWERIAINPAIDGPYVFFYQAMDSERVYELSEKIAGRIGKRLVVLSANINGRNSNECRNTSPLEFVGLIKNADMVLTSSFHATAFSILFRKEFYCVDLNMGDDNRIMDLLEGVGLGERIINSIDDIDFPPVDKKDCSNSLKDYQSIALSYLTSILQAE